MCISTARLFESSLGKVKGGWKIIMVFCHCNFKGYSKVPLLTSYKTTYLNRILIGNDDFLKMIVLSASDK
jgi:hypothetical protein